MTSAASSGSSYPYTATVTCAAGERVNVRQGAGLGHSHVARLDPGTQVTVLKSINSEWVKVSVNGITGYVMKKFLVDTKPGKFEITERDDNFVSVKPYTVTAKALNSKNDRSVGLRVKPNKTAKMVRRLTAGDELQVIARGKVWSKVIDLKTGKTGYVANEYIRKN